jgi:hypothetical protein
MGSKFLSTFIQAERPLEIVKRDAMIIFKSLGGTMMETPLGFRIMEGKFGVTMSMVANLTADVNIHQIKENQYDVQVYLNWTWGLFMWIMLVLGFFTGGFFCLFMLLYFAFEPSTIYNQMLYRLMTFEKLGSG